MPGWRWYGTRAEWRSSSRVLEARRGAERAISRRCGAGAPTLWPRRVDETESSRGAVALGVASPALCAQQGQRPFRLGTFPHSYEPWLTWVRDDFGAHGWQHGIEYVNVNSDAGYGDAVTVDAARALIGQKVDILTTYSTAHAVMPLTGSPKG